MFWKIQNLEHRQFGFVFFTYIMSQQSLSSHKNTMVRGHVESIHLVLYYIEQKLDKLIFLLRNHKILQLVLSAEFFEEVLCHARNVV